MKDAVSIQRVKLLHPLIRDEVADLIDKIEISNPFVVRVVQGLRTIEEQNALFEQGRTKPGNIVTNARGGSSYHNYGLAIDFALLYNGKLSWDLTTDFDHDNIKDWQEVVNVFKASGYEWGGEWKSLKDYPHLQKSFGYKWRQLFDKYNAKDFIPGTQYVNI
jgi:peptidoglycan L-alanyl-D-glutamate endopeptidase CwlK